MVSDIHLSDKAPTARLEQGEDWTTVMRETLRHLRTECHDHEVPLIISGDLFDVPKPSPGLIRLAWENLPDKVYVVAGNHDLPNHSMEELSESALGLMIAAERVTLLDFQPVSLSPFQLPSVDLYGVSWGEVVPPPLRLSSNVHNVAVIHRYCWEEGNTYPGAKQEEHVHQQVGSLHGRGYHAAVWGDNHRGFWTDPEPDGLTKWYNNGIAIPRNSDFKGYRPTYAHLMSDGTFDVQYFPKHLDAGWQPWVDEEKTQQASAQLLEFTKEVVKLAGQETGENFLDELQRNMSNLKDESVRQQVWAILQKAQELLK